MAVNVTKITIDGIDQQQGRDPYVNYIQRSQWLRAAILGANDGLVSTASLMIGVGAVKDDAKAMVISGFAGLVAGACSMAIGEFVSVYSQLDIEVAQMKREREMKSEGSGDFLEGHDRLPSPAQAAMASGIAFCLGAIVPLLAAGFIGEYKVRVGVVVAAVTVVSVLFGCVGAAIGRAPVVRSGLRVLVGGWIAMAMTFGLMKMLGCSGLKV